MSSQADLDPYNLTRYATVVESRQPGQQSTQLSQQGLSTQPQFSTILTEPAQGEYISSVTQVPVETRTSYLSQPTQLRQDLLPSQASSSEWKSVGIEQLYIPNRAPSIEEASKKEFDVSKKIIEAQVPLEVNVSDVVTVNKETGVYANKQDELGWTGALQISDYPINVDSSPEIIHKSLNQSVNYVQPVTVKYLKPPCPPKTGEIIIKQECDMRLPQAPPLIIRQRPNEPLTPEPLVLREQPFEAPSELDRKVISVPGKVLPPPPRRLIIEKLPMLPNKPRPIVIEKWLPCEPQTRTVKFIQADRTENWRSEKNLVIIWDGLKTKVTKELHNLGTVRACPEEYVQQHGGSLVSHYQMKSFIQEQNLSLPESTEHDPLPKLEGDIEALKLIDLDRYGLGEYKFLLTSPSAQSVYDSVFSQAKVDDRGKISKEEAKRLVIMIHERVGKQLNTQRIEEFVQDVCRNDSVGFAQFKRLVMNWVQV